MDTIYVDYHGGRYHASWNTDCGQEVTETSHLESEAIWRLRKAIFGRCVESDAYRVVRTHPARHEIVSRMKG